MVKVEEVQDAAYAAHDDRESDYATTDDDDAGYSSDSTISSLDSEDLAALEQETLLERFYALKDIIAPTTRSRLVKNWENTAGWVKKGSVWAGNAVWVITTSALLVGLPLALAMEDEARIVQQEKELQMQQSGQQSLLGGPQQQPQGVVPPGF